MRGKTTYNQADNIGEAGNTLADNPSDDPAGHTNSNPGTNGDEVALRHAAGFPEDADVDVLETDVAVDDTGTDDGRNGHTVGDLLEHGTGGSKSGRGHAGADVVVDDGGGSDVEDDLEALQQAESLGEVLGFLHLGDQTEEGDVGTVGEDNVGHSGEAVVDVCMLGGVDAGAAFVLDADADHGDHDCGEDANEGYRSWSVYCVHNLVGFHRKTYRQWKCRSCS